MSVDTAIVIVNYQTAGMLIDCISKMLDTIDFKSVAICIVDNFSNDGSYETIKDWVEDKQLSENVLLVRAATNGGFSAGNNIGIKAISAKYYLLLNSDAYIKQSSIDRLKKTFTLDPKIGLASPRLTWEDGTPQESTFNFFHPITEFVHQANTGVISSRLQKYVVAEAVNATARVVPWTSFACVMISSECIAKVGYLDEGFFMYFEDVEYCDRMRRTGFKVFHNPTASAVHLRGGSSSVKKNIARKKRLPKYYYQSRSRFYFKKYGYLGLFTANMFWYFGRGVSLCRQWMGRKDKAALEGQWKDIWANFSSPLAPYSHPGER